MGAGFRAVDKQLCVLTAEGLSLTEGLSMHSCPQRSIFSRGHLTDINLRSSVMFKKKKKEASFGVRWSVTPSSAICQLCRLGDFVFLSKLHFPGAKL